jgi:hypothetical protein
VVTVTYGLSAEITWSVACKLLRLRGRAAVDRPRGEGPAGVARPRPGEGTTRPDLCKAHGLSGAVLPIHGPASGALGRLVWLARLAGVSEAGSACTALHVVNLGRVAWWSARDSHRSVTGPAVSGSGRGDCTASASALHTGCIRFRFTFVHATPLKPPCWLLPSMDPWLTACLPASAARRALGQAMSRPGF